METENVPKPNPEEDKVKRDEREGKDKGGKSKDRERDEHKKSKKHKKKRSRSGSASQDSRSRSRSKDRRRKDDRKKTKSRRSRSRSYSPRRRRSDSRSRKSRRDRSRSRDRNNRDSRRKTRSRSKGRRDDKPRDTRDQRDNRDNTRDTRDNRGGQRDARDNRDKGRGGGGGFKFDSPPKELQSGELTVNLEEFGIPNMEVLKEMYPALKTMDQSEILQKLQLVNDMKNLQSSKVDRKLYIGNIPIGVTPQMLMDLLNSALQKLNINTETAGNSIIGAWISPDNHYAFCDFRTPEEATNGFALNSVAIHGQTLKVGRPRSYQQSQAPTNPLAAIFGSAGLPLNPLAVLGEAGNAPAVEVIQKIFPPSRILVLKNMAQISELEIDEEYNEIMEDVKDECSQHGRVLSVKIPRPQAGNTNIPGLGKIFVEYFTLDEAKEARKVLHLRTFGDNTVEVSYYDEEKYGNNDFTEA